MLHLQNMTSDGVKDGTDRHTGQCHHEHTVHKTHNLVLPELRITISVTCAVMFYS